MNITESPFLSPDHDEGGEHPAVITFRTMFILLNSVLIIAANIFCILVTKKSLTMEDATKVFTASLAITDFCIGIASLPSIVSSALDRWPFGSAMCRLTNDLFCILCTLSQIFLSCLGIDRLKAVQKPLQYNLIMTKNRAQVTVAVTFLVVITFYIIVPYSGYVDVEYEYRKSMTACILTFKKEGTYALLSGLLMTYFIPVAIVSSIYIKLLMVSWAQIRRIRQQIPMGPKPKLQGSILMFTFAMLASVVVWTLYASVALYECLMDQRAPPLVEFIAIWLPVSNSWWNVVIYARSNLSWRQTCVVMLRKMFKRKAKIEPTVAYITWKRQENK